jgi:branched-chain amino acid transport system substrate-binding protein
MKAQQRWLIYLALASLGLPACGTRVPSPEANPSETVPSRTTFPAVPLNSAASELRSAPGATATPRGPGPPPAASGSRPVGGVSVSTAPLSTSSSGGLSTKPREHGSFTLAGADAQSDLGKRPPIPNPAAKASPVIIGHVGTLSGPVGTAYKPIVSGTQIWVGFVNRRGGLNGHQVQLLVYDDGGDPARHRSQIQEAVERRGVVAFLANTDPMTGRQDVSYLEQKRVPHVGSMTGATWAYDSPMLFPSISEGEYGFFSWLASFASQMIPLRKTRLVTIACVEATPCTDVANTFSRRAKEVGFEYVSTIKTALAQPDYSAECLAARNSSAEAIVLLLDQNSIRRFTAACARQGYRPTYLLLSAVIEDAQEENPELTGAAGVTNVFPWFQTGTPATDEFQTAFRALGGNQRLNVGVTMGWVAGKLLQQAGAKLTEPPTSDAILQGLWTIQEDTLGGLTSPLTFTKDKPAVPTSCWFNLLLKDRWISPDDHQLRCR